MSVLNHKGYIGSVEADVQARVLHGKILFITDLVTYEADSIADLQRQFEDAVDDYIATCKEIGKPPQKPCTGQFNVRISPELHRELVLEAHETDGSLNAVVKAALETHLRRKHHHNGIDAAEVNPPKAASLKAAPKRVRRSKSIEKQGTRAE